LLVGLIVIGSGSLLLMGGKLFQIIFFFVPFVQIESYCYWLISRFDSEYMYSQLSILLEHYNPQLIIMNYVKEISVTYVSHWINWCGHQGFLE